MKEPDTESRHRAHSHVGAEKVGFAEIQARVGVPRGRGWLEGDRGLGGFKGHVLDDHS